MSRNIEIEAKSLIDEKSYRKLIKGKESEIYTQINYYIDTKSFDVHERKMGLRVREKDGAFELTLKLKKDEGKLEINQDIAPNEFYEFKHLHHFPNGEVKETLIELGIDIDSLYIFTVLTTKRLDISYKGCLISIDESSFNGIIDHEVECESDSMENAKSVLIEFLNKNEVPYQENFVSKLKRARDSL